MKRIHLRTRISIDDDDHEKHDEGEASPVMDDYEVLLSSELKVWKTYKNKILMPYVYAAYLLSPNPISMSHAKDPANKDPKDCLAIECLIYVHSVSLSSHNRNSIGKEGRAYLYFLERI